MTFNSAEPLLTVNDAARFFVVSPKTVRFWLWQGKLTSLKVGGAVRFRQSDLDAFVHQRQHKVTA